MTLKTREVTILVIEDDDVDAESIRRSFKRLKIVNPLIRAHDGIEALSLLRGETDRRPIEKPYIVLLDINLPRMNGIEFLRVVRQDDKLRDSIIFVLTTSKADQDRIAAYHHNVAGYIVKSDVEDGFRNVLKMIKNYWRIVELPV